MGNPKPGVVLPVPIPRLALLKGYVPFFEKLKERVAQERVRAILSASSSMVLLYWDMGNSILERQRDEGWGAKVIDRLSHDLNKAFPDAHGFSPRNLKYMRKFAECWPDREIVQRTVAQIPWRSNITLMDKLDDPEIRLWYGEKTLEMGFGKDMLVIQIESGLHLREGAAITNFPNVLPPLESDMTAQVFKDPYFC